MSSVGRNIFKMALGSALGAAVGVAVSKVLEERQRPDDLTDAVDQEGPTAVDRVKSITNEVKGRIQRTSSDDPLAMDIEEDDGPSPVEKVKAVPNNLKSRWQRAKEAGVAAQVEEEARLRALYRQKVNDPMALTEEPTSDD
ncbi:MAG: hypothetical protein ACOC9Y_00325 [Chloroflexota bacterium]